ncbi:MAG: hypothetical protein D3908_12670, partial [Candidatus Electrothrix sp. AUS4]|nr:hypothetical protein [Candidatus Electrothrix sp. AUS4]
RKPMNKEEIEKELKQIPKAWIHAFAARLTSQSLPGLLYKLNFDDPPFAYWPEEKRTRGLFSVLRMNTAVEFYSAYRLIDCGETRKDYLEIDSNYLKTERIYSEIPSLYFGTESSKSLRAARHSINLLLFFNKDEDRFIREAVEIADFVQKISIDIANEVIDLKAHVKDSSYFYHPLYTSQSQEWLQHAKKFVQVLRDYGSGFDLWADWFQGRIDGIPTDKKFLEAVINLPEEILAQEPAQINAYLKENSLTDRPLNRVRVIFLGDGATGKTSLIRALNGLEVVEGGGKMTPGIDISDWEVPDTEIIAHLWDFGGQVVAHATHQFFLRSRCLYVLLLDGRTEINANEQAEYWLEHVRAFGNKAPVMLVGNKADLCAVNLDMARLKEKHPNVIDFYPLSCTQYQDQYADKFLCFKNDLSKGLEKLGLHQIHFNKAHFAVLKELTGRSG